MVSNLNRPNANSKVAFIVSKFPCYDEAFILRELYAVSTKVATVIYSLKAADEKTIHAEAGELLDRTFYLPYFSWKLFKALIHLFFAGGSQGRNALCQLVLRNLRSPEFLLKNLAFVLKAVGFARLAEEQGVRHIHAYWATYPTSVALLISDITAIPFSFSGHAHDIYLNTTNLDTKMVRAAFIATCTRRNQEYLQRLLPSCRNKVVLNYHGLDLESFFVSEKPLHATLELLSVATLQQHKGLAYLIDALALLRERGIAFHCTIIGGGPLETELRKRIHKLSLVRLVEMTGALPQTSIVPHYKNADVFILMAQPEWHWGIANVLIEALAAKAAVITTRFGSVEELIQNDETGLLVPPTDAEQLSRAIERLYRDSHSRSRLSLAGQRLVQDNFDLKKTAERMLAQLESWQA